MCIRDSAIIALGYTMVYGIAKMLNFAHGDVIMIGSYVVFVTVSTMGLPPMAGVLLAVAVCTLLGMTIERIAYKPLRDVYKRQIQISLVVVLVKFLKTVGEEAEGTAYDDLVSLALL